ncbi:MAG: hypothetical protein IPH10_02215 [bacterium]|nr:hypothetical protein [bacterium]
MEHKCGGDCRRIVIRRNAEVAVSGNHDDAATLFETVIRREEPVIYPVSVKIARFTDAVWVVMPWASRTHAGAVGNGLPPKPDLDLVFKPHYRKSIVVKGIADVAMA